ncbi:hypothetical protein, unknown function [Leishmania mexicana MHOM/GT/2001/U1103]|uniref:Guanine nucleotide-binding protein subunit beta-like protein n=1 Tax=Leishmania mexicana (strain MHOM/GT/2001/U1103) TaxID=929439 RepID=E9B6K9_LEIMU|nr:hypothetical protein, unknown function [Leishmania mexicana MHOM/GT/2001/U1103]CBZ30881.1 hypothetical protein, unknown function [Leishmania mexicana MHOM/GT/2001/U1103]
MSCIASAFDSFRCAYSGVSDSVNDIDVDLTGGCLYAACSSGDVCVWNIQTQKLRVRLRHSQWVNAVRCFPMCNSAASSAALPQPPLAASPAAVAGRVECDTAHADLVVNHDIRWVLTGTEDGAVAIWCPVTYRMQSIFKPGRAAITALQLIPETSPCAPDKANASKMEHCTTGARFRQASTKVNDGPAICCAASLRDVYVFRVTTASSELQLLHAFQHHGLITALTYVAPSMSLSTPLLVVGQEEGTLCVWNCATWAYHDTMPYPTGEVDVTADARDDPTSVHEPVYQLGRVFKTFLYNRRRCNPLSDQAAIEEEAAAAAPVDSTDYMGVLPASVSADAIDVLERNCGTLPYNAKQAFLEQHQQRQQQGPDGTRFPTAPRDWRYDKRRVTCLAASPNPRSSNPNSYLYSGHATGEVLLWGSVRQELPLLLLLKKIVLFKPGVWVWNLCAVATLHTTASQPSEQRGSAKAAAKSLSRLGKKKANERARTKTETSLTPTHYARAGAPSLLQTTHVSPLELIVWSDCGAVEYVSTRKYQVLHRQGPGFVCAAACGWSGPTITLPPAAEPVSTFDNGRAGAATSSTEAASKRSGAATRGSRHASTFSAHQYLVMAGFDGRLERYDVTEVLELVKSSGKVV